MKSNKDNVVTKIESNQFNIELYYKSGNTQQIIITLKDTTEACVAYVKEGTDGKDYITSSDTGSNDISLTYIRTEVSQTLSDLYNMVVDKLVNFEFEQFRYVPTDILLQRRIVILTFAFNLTVGQFRMTPAELTSMVKKASETNSIFLHLATSIMQYYAPNTIKNTSAHNATSVFTRDCNSNIVNLISSAGMDKSVSYVLTNRNPLDVTEDFCSAYFYTGNSILRKCSKRMGAIFNLDTDDVNNIKLGHMNLHGFINIMRGPMEYDGNIMIRLLMEMEEAQDMEYGDFLHFLAIVIPNGDYLMELENNK